MGYRPPNARNRNRKPQKKRRSAGRTAREVRQKGGLRVKHNRKPPIPLRVLLILIIPLSIVHLINGVFLSSFYSFFSVLFLIIYFIAGYIGGNHWFADHPKYRHGAKPQAVREGAACGLTLGVMNFLLLVIFVIVFGFVSSGLSMIFGGVNVILCAPGEIVSSLILGAFGGWISERRH